jgi:Uma2 family endonuclease
MAATTDVYASATVAPGSSSAPVLTFVPIEQYLRTSYRPDVEYIDGYLREKPGVMSVNGRLQSLLSHWFVSHEEEWQVMVGVEIRMRIDASRVRLPDVIVDHARFWPETLVEPPLLLIEILSPSDTYGEMRRRIQDYLTMGGKTVWVIDPETRKGEVHGVRMEADATRLTVAGTPIYVDLAEIFARLDKHQPGVASAPAEVG